jgi:hypothetical protein
MLEIEYRAKLKNDPEGNKWVYGWPYFEDQEVKGDRKLCRFLYPGITGSLQSVEVDPESICRFIGRRDINNNKIYETDILQDGIIRGYVAFDGISCILKHGDVGYVLRAKEYEKCEIIGNKSDTPELFKKLQ